MNYFLQKIGKEECETRRIERRKNTHETDEWKYPTGLKKTFYFLPKIHGFILGYFLQIQLR